MNHQQTRVNQGEEEDGGIIENADKAQTRHKVTVEKCCVGQLTGC